MRRIKAVLAALLLTACGPMTVRDLKMELADTSTPRAGLQRLRTLCEEPGLACASVRAELCAKDAKNIRQQAAAAFERQRFAQVAQMQRSRPEECGTDSRLRALVDTAGALSACYLKGDDACALAVVRGLDPKALPELAAWHQRQHPWICGDLLARAPSTPRGHHLLQSLAWCTPAQRADLKARTLAGLSRGEPTPQQAVQACAELRHVMSDDPQVAATCEALTQRLGETLASAARAAAPEAPGAALVLANRAKQLGVDISDTTLITWRARLEGLATTPVRWSAEGADAEGRDVLAQVEAALLKALPKGFVWAPEGDALALSAKIGPVRTKETRSHSKAAHRYVARHRKVDNPEWREAKGACERAKSALKRCVRAQRDEKRERRACKARNRKAEREYQACWAARRSGKSVQLCQERSERCDSVRHCNTSDMDRYCALADRLPPTLLEPVYALYHYPVETVTEKLEAPFEVEARLKRGAPHSRAQSVWHKSTDSHHAGAEHVGLKADPLELASRATALRAMARHGVQLAKLALKAVRADHCERLLATRRAAQQAADLLRVVQLDEQRIVAGCAVPTEQKAQAEQALLRSL